MADLETTAGDALLAVRQLEARVADANGRLDQLREQALHTIDQRCQAMWHHLEEELAAFHTILSEKQGVVHELGRDALGSLGGGRLRMGQAYQVAASHLDEAGDTMESLQAEVASHEPEVAALVAGLEAAAQATGQRLAAAQDDLEQAVQAARAFVGVEVVQELQSMQEEVREHAAGVRRIVAEECRLAVETAQIDWEAKLVEVMGTIEEAHRGMTAHAEEVAAFALEKCQEAFELVLADLTEAAANVAAAVETFQVEVEEAHRESATADGALESGVAETIAALGSAHATIVGVLTELAKYAWVVL